MNLPTYEKHDYAAAAALGGDKPATPAAEPAEVAAIKIALRAQLLAVLAGPFGARALLKLERLARLSREMLETHADPSSRGRRSVNSLAYGSDVDAWQEGAIGYDTGGGGMQLVGGLPGPPGGLRAETFGATLVREAVAAMKEARTPKPTLADLTSALAAAKDAGLGVQVISRLEAALHDALAPAPAVAPEAARASSPIGLYGTTDTLPPNTDARPSP